MLNRLRNRIDTIEKIIFYSWWLVGLFFKVIYFQFSGAINFKPFFNDRNNIMYITTISSIFIMFSILILIFNKKRRLVLLISYCLGSIVLLGDVLYSRYYYSPLNVSMVNQIFILGDVKASITSLYRRIDLILLADLIVIIILYIRIRKRTLFFDIKRRLMVSANFFVIGLILFFYAYSNVDASAYMYQRKYVARDLGVIYYHYFDLKDTLSRHLFRNKTITDEELLLINDNIFVSKEDELYGLLEGKNLIVIQLEAIQNFLINQKIEGEEITPFLNGLIKESIYFNNIYHQVSYGNTSDAEFILNTSLHPAKGGPVNYMYVSNTYYTLPKALRELNYNSYGFHAFEPSFWNRTNMYNSLGFNKFYSINDFNLTEILGWALSDKELFIQSIDHVLEKNGKDNPFYAFMITLSSHHPFDAFYDYPFYVGRYENTQLGHYIKSAHYVDYAISELLKHLKDTGLYENSVIVIYGDHSGLFADQKSDLLRFLEIEDSFYTWKRLQQVPFIIHSPGLDPGIIESVGGQIDILPTLSHLMGLEMPYMLGKNLLSEDSRIVVNRDGSVITNEFMYLPETDKVFLFDEGIEVNKSEYMDFINKGYIELRVTDIILEKNAIDQLN